MRNVSVEQVGYWGTRLVATGSILFSSCIILGTYNQAETGAPSWLFITADYALALVGLAGLAAVPALSARVASLSEGWVQLTSRVALLGFALLAVMSFWQAEYETTQALQSVGLPGIEYEPAASPFVEEGTSRLTLALDELHVRTPQSWLEAGLVGLWILSISWLGRGVFPIGLSRLGIAAGTFMVAAALGAAVQLFELAVVGQFVGVLILMPLWFARVGSIVRPPEHVAVSRPPLALDPPGWMSGGRLLRRRPRHGRHSASTAPLPTRP